LGAQGTHLSVELGCKVRDSHSTLLSYNSSQILGRDFSYIYLFIIKDMIKGATGQPCKGGQRMRSGRVPSAGTSVSEDAFTNLKTVNPIV
jgi:hypothetical protein